MLLLYAPLVCLILHRFRLLIEYVLEQLLISYCLLPHFQLILAPQLQDIQVQLLNKQELLLQLSLRIFLALEILQFFQQGIKVLLLMILKLLVLSPVLLFHLFLYLFLPFNFIIFSRPLINIIKDRSNQSYHSFVKNINSN